MKKDRERGKKERKESPFLEEKTKRKQEKGKRGALLSDLEAVKKGKLLKGGGEKMKTSNLKEASRWGKLLKTFGCIWQKT